MIGRTKAAVDAAFAAANRRGHRAVDRRLRHRCGDAGRGRPGPSSYTTKVSNKTYTVTTLIGTCYRPKTASASDQNCTKADPGAAASCTASPSW